MLIPAHIPLLVNIVIDSPQREKEMKFMYQRKYKYREAARFFYHLTLAQEKYSKLSTERIKKYF